MNNIEVLKLKIFYSEVFIITVSAAKGICQLYNNCVVMRAICKLLLAENCILPYIIHTINKRTQSSMRVVQYIKSTANGLILRNLYHMLIDVELAKALANIFEFNCAGSSLQQVRSQ